MINSSYKAIYNGLFGDILKEGKAGFYDEAALPSYTHKNVLMSWFFWKRIETALCMAGEVEGKSVLDFGCGGGVTFKYLAEKNCRIMGCENKFFEMTRSLCERLDIKADIYEDLMDISDISFDLIFALDVFEHIEDTGKYIEKLKEISDNNTMVIISGPTENILYKIGRKLARFSGDYHVTNIYDVEREFLDRGFKKTKLKKLYFPFTLFRISCWHK